MILADMIGQTNPAFLREIEFHEVADGSRVEHGRAPRLQRYFRVARNAKSRTTISPFLERGVPAVDIIDLRRLPELGYWHTPQDTLDKVSPRSLAIVGHVILESVDDCRRRARRLHANCRCAAASLSTASNEIPPRFTRMLLNIWVAFCARSRGNSTS